MFDTMGLRGILPYGLLGAHRMWQILHYEVHFLVGMAFYPHLALMSFNRLISLFFCLVIWSVGILL